MPMIIGIDLGTTYSCLSYIDSNGDVQIQQSREGGRTVPSVILFDDEGFPVVGEVAKEQADAFPEDQVVELIKRQMGTDYTVEILGETYKPQTLSAMIVKKLLDDFRTQHPDEEIQHVVITCPAYFGTEARNATKEAGLMAGIPEEALTILDEPTAAAISYAASNPGEKTVLVYDLGGGTFDVSILKITDTVYENLTTDGNKLLGGKDWDHILGDLIKQKIEDEGNVTIDEIEGDDEARRRLAIDCEGIKKSLTSMPSVKKKLVVGPTSAQYSVTREEFETVTKGKVDETLVIVDRCLSKIGYTIDNIDEIIMVGGSSKMPMIMKALEDKFPGVTIKLSDPDEAVAKGAALYSCLKLVDKSREGVIDIDDNEIPIPQVIEKRIGDGSVGADAVVGLIMSKSYGIKCLDENDKEVVANILFRDMKLPLSESDRFYPANDGQRSLKIEIYESEASQDQKYIEPNPENIVGDFNLDLPNGASRNDVVDVTFIANGEGLISCHVECLGESADKKLEVKNSMSAEDLKKAADAVRMVR